MGLNWRDVGQAIIDLRLQIVIIIFTLIVLSIAGFLLGKRGTRLNNDSQPNLPKKPYRRYTPAQLQRLSRMGRYAILEQPKVPASTYGLTWQASFWQGMSTEFFGAVVTTIFLGLGVLIFDQYQDIQNRKADLILQMGSDERVWAVEAARQLNTEGWLYDGTLQGVYLNYANLQGATLMKSERTDVAQRMRIVGANLQGVFLTWGNLQQANLNGANLQGARLDNADLRGIRLTGANLQGAVLYYTNLQGAALVGADLRNADLVGANLQGATLEHRTILPDGSAWTPDTDIGRFTDINHIDFWNPCIEIVPAPWHCGD